MCSSISQNPRPSTCPRFPIRSPQAGPHPEQLGGLAGLGHLPAQRVAGATSLRLCPPGPARLPRRQPLLPLPPGREPGLLGSSVSPPCPSLGALAALPGRSSLASGLGWTPGPLQRPCQVVVLTGTSGGKAPSQPPQGTPWPVGLPGLQPHAAPSHPPHSPRPPGEPAGTCARPHLAWRGRLHTFR